MRDIKEIQTQRLNRITNVCDMCTHAEKTAVNSERRTIHTEHNTSKKPECQQLTEFPLRREMLNHILVDDTHKVK